MSENLVDSDFLKLIVENMVDEKESVSVDRTTDDKGVLLTLHVAAADMGKIIGKEGATSKAIRLIMRAKGRRDNALVSLKIAEPEGGRYEKQEPMDSSQAEAV